VTVAAADFIVFYKMADILLPLAMLALYIHDFVRECPGPHTSCVLGPEHAETAQQQRVPFVFRSTMRPAAVLAPCVVVEAAECLRQDTVVALVGPPVRVAIASPLASDATHADAVLARPEEKLWVPGGWWIATSGPVALYLA
jgi:hypothetical protein